MMTLLELYDPYMKKKLQIQYNFKYSGPVWPSRNKTDIKGLVPCRVEDVVVVGSSGLRTWYVIMSVWLSGLYLKQKSSTTLTRVSSFYHDLNTMPARLVSCPVLSRLILVLSKSVTSILRYPYGYSSLPYVVLHVYQVSSPLRCW